MSAAATNFAKKYPQAAIFTRGHGNAMVMAAADRQRLMLKAVGNAPSEQVVELVRDLYAAGHFAGDHTTSLVDITEFTGAVDWNEIRKIIQVIPESPRRSSRNAYVVHDGFLAMIAKITAAIFPNTECAAFTTEREALAWLGWN